MTTTSEASAITQPRRDLPLIVSVDDHVIEPPNVWTERLPAKLREQGPRVVRLPAGELRLEGARSQVAHTHAVATIAVLINGKAMSEGPDTQAKANAPAPIGLKQLDQPGQWILVPAGDKHYVVRLGTADARLVEIEVR